MAYRIGRRMFSPAAAIATIFILLTAATIAKDIQTPEPASGPLDGMVFVGKIGPQGRQDFDEELHFSGGHFWSNNCLTCGYQPNIYWARNVGGDVEFRSELASADGSRFSYLGRISKGRAHVTVRWTKQRWYWTIDQVLVFDGVLTPDRRAVPVDDARRSAESATRRPLPQWCT